MTFAQMTIPRSKELFGARAACRELAFLLPDALLLLVFLPGGGATLGLVFGGAGCRCVGPVYPAFCLEDCINSRSAAILSTRERDIEGISCCSCTCSCCTCCSCSSSGST